MEWLATGWGTAAQVWLLLGLGGLAGLLAGVTGTTGGFLVTPLLVLAGLSPAVAAAAGTGQVALTSWPGTLVHRRLGSLDSKLVVRLVAGSIPGGAAGVFVVHLLREAGIYDGLLRIMYVAVLASVAAFFVRPWLRKGMPGDKARNPCSLGVAVTLGFACGLWAAVLGGGGGMLAFAVLAGAVGLPVITAAGTALALGALTAAHVVLWQATVNHTVSLPLVALLALGAWLGGRVGTRLVGRLSPDAYRRLMAAVLGVIAVQLLVAGVLR